MLTVLVSAIFNSQVFCWKNVSSFCKCKSCSHFFCKNISVYAIFYDQNVNDTLTNDIVSFEQLGPDIHHRRSSIVCHKIVYKHSAFHNLDSFEPTFICILIRFSIPVLSINLCFISWAFSGYNPYWDEASAKFQSWFWCQCRTNLCFPHHFNITFLRLNSIKIVILKWIKINV